MSKQDRALALVAVLAALGAIAVTVARPEWLDPYRVGLLWVLGIIFVVCLVWLLVDLLGPSQSAKLKLELQRGPDLDDEPYYVIRVLNRGTVNATNVRAWVTITKPDGAHVNGAPWGEHQIAWEPHSLGEGRFARSVADIGPHAHDNIQFASRQGQNVLIRTQSEMPMLDFPGSYLACVKVMSDNAKAVSMRIRFGLDDEWNLLAESVR